MTPSDKARDIAREVVERIVRDIHDREYLALAWTRIGRPDARLQIRDEWVALVTPVIEEALLPLRGENADLLARLDAAAFGATQVQAEIEERQRAFDLRWEADQRAIKRWHDAGNPPLVWPDHADLCVWLLGESERLTQRVRELETGLRDTLATRGRPQRDEHLSNVAFQTALEADRAARRLLSQPPAPQPSEPTEEDATDAAATRVLYETQTVTAFEPVVPFPSEPAPPTTTPEATWVCRTCGDSAVRSHAGMWRCPNCKATCSAPGKCMTSSDDIDRCAFTLREPTPRRTTASHPKAKPQSARARWIEGVIQHIQELPDRTSPDDFPDAMLVTSDELRDALWAAFEQGQP